MMSSHREVRIVFAVMALCLMLAGTVSAQRIPPIQPTAGSHQPQGTPPETRVVGPGVRVSTSTNQPSLNPGQLAASGTSFRFTGQIGETQVPYFTDENHLMRPRGEYIDPVTNHLYITEEGFRVVEFDANGVGVRAIGMPGVSNVEDYRFGDPQDVAQDGNGNFWVADWTRVAQYDSNWQFLQNFPAIDPWGGGDGNDRFNGANGIAFDTQGRMYISDRYNHRVQVFTFTNGEPVYYKTIGNGQGNGADQFSEPMRINVDSADNLFVADYGNNRVQKCVFNAGTETWSCTTFKSGLNHPNGVVTYGTNIVYIADTDNGKVLKCVSGVCNDFVYYWSMDLAVDSAGNLYIDQLYEDNIRKFSASGIDRGVFAGIPYEPYTTDLNHFYRPHIATDAQNNLVVVEENGQRLLKMKADGTAVCHIGVPGLDMYPPDGLAWARDVATDASGQIYVAGGDMVWIFDSNCNYKYGIGPETGTGIANDRFSWPAGVAVAPNGNIYVSDPDHHRILIYNSSRQYSGVIGQKDNCGNSATLLCHPLSLGMDKSGNLYAYDEWNYRLLKFNSNRQLVLTLGTPGECGDDFTHFCSSGDVTVDDTGRIYVGDMWNNGVKVYDSTGSYLTTIGGSWGTHSSQFEGAAGVAVDSNGTVYVADWNNARIQKFTRGVPGWLQVNINGFGERWGPIGALEVYNGQLYAASSYWGPGGSIYHSSNGRSWTPVADAGVVATSDSPAILDMQVYNGKLYAVTGWGNNISQVSRYDGTNWEKVFEQSTNGFDLMVAYNGYLYVAGNENDDGPGMGIWRSPSGNLGTWEQVVSAGNGDTNNAILSGFAVFNNQLLAVVRNRVNGPEIWSTTNGTTWNRVVTGGNGSGSDLDDTASFVTYKDTLYVSMHSAQNGPVLWKSSDGDTWETVVTSGLDNPDDAMFESFFEIQGQLYGTLNNSVDGMGIWRTSNGADWQPVETGGFGNSNNNWSLWGNATTWFNGALYFAPWDGGNGGQVWEWLPNTMFMPTIRK